LSTNAEVTFHDSGAEFGPAKTVDEKPGLTTGCFLHPLGLGIIKEALLPRGIRPKWEMQVL
jgi:hypothetical protein